MRVFAAIISFGLALQLAGCAGRDASVLPVRPASADRANAPNLEGANAAVDRAIGPVVDRTNATTVDHANTTTLKLYVADRTSNAVTVYLDAANGDVKPIFRIRGANTFLNLPSSLGFDGFRQLYVLNASSLAVFAAGARGNAIPKYLISGGATMLSNPQAVTVDPTGKTYVTNDASSGGYITAYAAGEDGDRAPVQEIIDDVSLLFVPAGIALHGGLLYVADPGDQSINEYSDQANGLTQPVAVINGLNSPDGIAVDAKGRIYVTDSNSIVVYAASASGFAKPLRTIFGSQTLMNGAAGLTVHNSEIAVANSGNNSVTVYPQTGNGNVAPLRQLIGVDTGLSDPQSVTVH